MSRSSSIKRMCRYLAVVVYFLGFFQTTQLKCDAFQSATFKPGKLSICRNPSACHVLLEPPSGNKGARNPKASSRNVRRVIKSKKKFRSDHKGDVWSSGRWNKAISVESKLKNALDALQEMIKVTENSGTDLDQYPLSFPGIRECNAALASFGDGGDLLRALRLYFKMRKTASLSRRYPARIREPIPIPTLVTFSTMMSRAVYLGKPLVAIRLWKIMRREPDFFSSSISESSTQIVPDVKSANILMNAYAKLGDIEMAQDLFDQMVNGNGDDVPKMKPNLVTYNTLLDACHKSGELDIAIRVKELLDYTEIKPDARTYTTLIATVARKVTAASGANDPSLAFTFLKEMKSLNITPNGKTYSALIDVCGRCSRSDLALKGLRLMLDQKAQEQRMLHSSAQRGYTLPSEVGAWTAAIDACGKAGRIDTAQKLFYSMPNYGVYPNTVTCGSMVDCLLRNGRTAESLDVLRYMEKNRISPSEVMYTSLMTSASRLAQFENHQIDKEAREEATFILDDSGSTKAVEVYTELMTSLSKVKPAAKKVTPSLRSKSGDDTDELFRVSLVFQEMKAAGVEPDLACYNALLKSCAKSGDVDRALSVLDQIREADEMEPNENTWNAVIRAAGKARRTDVALATWKSAVEEAIARKDDKRASRSRTLSERSLGALLLTLVRSAEDEKIDKHTKIRLYQLVLKLHMALMANSSFLGMDLVDKDRVLENSGIMASFLQAVVSLENYVSSGGENVNLDSKQLKRIAISIVQLDCFKDGLTFHLRKNASLFNAYQISSSWK